VHSIPYNDYERGRGEGGFNRLNRYLMIVIIAGLLIVGGLASVPIFQQYSEQDAKLSQLENDLARERAIHARRVREEQLLKNDPAYLEIISRDKLDVMKPGETIIHFESPKKN